MEKGTLEDKNRSNFSCPKRTGDKLPKEEPDEDERQKPSLNRKRGKKALCSETKRNLQKARRIGAPPSLPEICSGLKPATTEMQKKT